MKLVTLPYDVLQKMIDLVGQQPIDSGFYQLFPKLVQAQQEADHEEPIYKEIKVVAKKAKPVARKEMQPLRPQVFAQFKELASVNPNFGMDDVKLGKGWRKNKIQSMFVEFKNGAVE